MCILELDGLCGTQVRILKDLEDGREHAWPHFFCHDPRQLDGNITRWNDIHGLLDDPFVMAFLQGAAYALQMTPALVQTLTMEYPTEVGFEGIADISTGEHEVQMVNRRGQLVQVVREKPGKTKLLTFYFSFRDNCWYIGTVYAGPASPSFKDTDWWSKHAFYDMREVSEEC